MSKHQAINEWISLFVMGWEVVGRVPPNEVNEEPCMVFGDGASSYVCTSDMLDFSKAYDIFDLVDGYETFIPTKNLSDTSRLLDRLSELGYEMLLQLMPNGKFRAEVWATNSDSGNFSATTDSFPHSLCLAVTKACNGINKPHLDA